MANLFDEADKGDGDLAGDENEGNDDDNNDDVLADMRGADQMHQAYALLISLIDAFVAAVIVVDIGISCALSSLHCFLFSRFTSP